MANEVRFEELLRGLENLAGAIGGPVVEAGLDAAAKVALDGKTRAVRDPTYVRSIPRGKNGKPKWTRSGDWLKGQTIEAEPGRRTIGTQGNAEKYEPRLANLPPGADGVNRTNNAAARGFERVKPQLMPVFEAAVRDKLGF